MSKNLIPEVCKLVGVEIGEEFKIKRSGVVENEIYVINENGTLNINRNGEAKPTYMVTLMDFFLGSVEIFKLPWKPKKGEKYWTFDFSADTIFNHHVWEVSGEVWANLPYDIALYRAGWAYRTEEEANAALPIVAKECGVKYYKCSIIHGNGDYKLGSNNDE